MPETATDAVNRLILETDEIGLLPEAQGMGLDTLSSIARGRLKGVLNEAMIVLRHLPEGQQLVANCIMMLASNARPDEVSQALRRALRYTDQVRRQPAPALAMPAKQPYIDDAHMAELRSLQALKLPLDVSRLVRLCDELNAVYRGECVMAVAMLCRAIKDHCPPVFGQTNFANVVSHTSAQSTRKILEQLESGLKNVADRHLHAHIRPREAIPAMTEVEFRPAMNVLIGEICVALRSKT